MNMRVGRYFCVPDIETQMAPSNYLAGILVLSQRKCGGPRQQLSCSRQTAQNLDKFAKLVVRRHSMTRMPTW
jgi:hypothetical protein